MKIGIMGTPVTSGNRGVMALGASLINLCSHAPDAGNVTLFLGNREDRPATFRVHTHPRQIRVVNVRLSPRSNPRQHLLMVVFMSLVFRFVPIPVLRRAIAKWFPWIQAVLDADVVGDVRGGDSFSDIYGARRFLHGFFMAWSVILIKRSIVQFPQTFGPYKSGWSRILAKFLLKRSSLIIARDKASRRVAQDLVGPAKEVLLSPDVAFSLDVVRPTGIELAPPAMGSVPGKIVGLNVNGLMFNGGYNRSNMFGLKLDYPKFLNRLVIALLQEQAGEIWLVPHTYAAASSVESDNEACRQLRDCLPNELKPRVRIVAREYDCHELKGIIGQCDFFVGARMHSCIGALSQGIPCVGIAYSMKFAGVFESVGMQDWVVDARSLSEEEAVARLLSLYRLRESIRSELGRRSEEARQRLKAIFEGLAESPSKAGRPSMHLEKAGL